MVYINKGLGLGLLFKSKKDYEELKIVDDNIFNIIKILKNTNPESSNYWSVNLLWPKK